MARRCLRVASPRSWSRATKTMRAPFCASLSAATSPMPDVAPVITTTLSFIAKSIVRRATAPLPHDFKIGKEETDFMRRGFRRVGTMHRIRLDVLREILADRAGRCFCRVRRAHHFAVLADSVFTFQNLHDHGAGGHELAQAFEERPCLVDVVEGFRLRHRKLHALGSDHAQTRLLEPVDDGAGVIAPCGIRPDDGTRALNGHLKPLE